MKKNSLISKLVAMGLAVMLLGTACSSPAPKAAADGGTKTDAGTQANTPVDAANAPTLTWIMGNPGVIPPDLDMVEAKLNELSVPAIGAKVKTLFYDAEKTKLALSSGEDWDMAFTCEWFNDFAVQARSGYFADITDKLKTVTPNLYASMPEVVWKGTEIEGKIMAIPIKKDYAAEQFFQFDKALYVDALKMEIPDKMQFADIEKYLKAAKDAFAAGNEAAKQAEYPLKLTKGGFPIDSNFDMINRDLGIAIPYSKVGTADAAKVTFTFETPDFMERVKLIRKWYNEGYINKDAATVDDVGKYSAIKFGQGFYGADAIWSSGNGYTVQIAKWDGPYLSTSSIRGAMNAINAKSKNIDLSLKFQEYINTDETYRTTIRYGVEGTHWNKTPEGLAKRTDVGVKNYNVWGFSQGSYALGLVEAAEGVKVDPKMWDVIFDGYKELVATDTIGFAFDVTKVEAQVAASKAVKDKYWIGLITGTLDPETTIPQMVTEMEAAGAKDVLAECQTQLDAFMAAKK